MVALGADRASSLTFYTHPSACLRLFEGAQTVLFCFLEKEQDCSFLFLHHKLFFFVFSTRKLRGKRQGRVFLLDAGCSGRRQCCCAQWGWQAPSRLRRCHCALSLRRSHRCELRAAGSPLRCLGREQGANPTYSNPAAAAATDADALHATMPACRPAVSAVKMQMNDNTRKSFISLVFCTSARSCLRWHARAFRC